MGEKGSAFNFEKLNNSNYSAWAFKMQMLLMKESCWDSIEHVGEEMVPAMLTKDRKAWNIIVLGVDDNQHVHVKGTKGGKEAWNKLKDFHIQTTLSARIRIMKRLFRIRLEDGTTMHEHLQSIFERFSELDEIGYGLENDMAVSILLASLNPDYEPLITALEAWDESRLTIQAVRAKLIEEWQRKSQTTQEESNETALRTFQRKDERVCFGCNKRGHILKFCRSRPQERATQERTTQERASVAKVAFSARFNAVEKRIKRRKKRTDFRICYNCGEYGHDIAYCPTKKKMKSLVVVSTDNGLSKEIRSAKMARLSQMYVLVSLNNYEFQSWIIDSGASNHMCCDEKLFQSLNRGSFGEIITANGDKIKAKGKGRINLLVGEKENYIEVTLIDVLFVPELATNLMSVERMTKLGFSVNFSNSDCHLNGNFGSCLIGKHRNGVYGVVEPKFSCAATRRDTKCVHEWHRILAHRHLNDVKNMKQIGFKFEDCGCEDVCEACVKGKMSRLPFPKFSEKKKNRLECVVSDVCGPMKTQTVNHAKYFITFTDLYSGYTEVSFMKTKDETAEKTIQFIEKLKTQLNQKPKVFRSDRGGEYLNEHLQTYLKNEGIEPQCTVSYSAQQNGVAERKNRTLMEAARTLLIDSKLPNKFWAEAIHNANYTFNRIIKRSSDKTPYELLFNKVPEFDFHQFGSDVYVMIPYQKRRKLDVKAEKMRFLGHDDMSKGFRVLDDRGVIKISRDVKFINKSCSDQIEVEETLNVENDTEDESEGEKSDIEDNYEPSDDGENEEFLSDFEDFQETPADKSDDVIIVEPEVLETETSKPNTRSQSKVKKANNGDRTENYKTAKPNTRSKSKETGENSTKMKALYNVKNELKREPRSYQEAMNSANHEDWEKAMREELNSIKENGTWTLTDLPSNRKSIGSKWVFKTKQDENGKVVRFKARLVAQGFTQKYGVDYDEVFAPVARSTTLRVLLSIAGKKNYFAKHFDVKTAFLNGNLEEEIFMRQPPGFKTGDKVYRLNKSLYGLKQAARVWNLTLHNELIKIGFNQSNVDKCLYVLSEPGKVCYLLVHVDDMVLVSNKEFFLETIAARIGKKFEMKNLGNVKHYLGIDIEQDEDNNFIMSQNSYIQKIIDEAGLTDAKVSKYPMDKGYYKIKDNILLPDNKEYRKLVGMLLYLTNHTRPDIAASVSILSQKVSNPNQTDMNEVKRVVRYLKGTMKLKLKLSSALGEQQLHSYSDANWAEDRKTGKSNSGYYCSFNGGAISWSCRLQDIVALSSTEAEYVALSETCKETIWLKKLLSFFDVNISSEILVLTDSQSCMKMIKNDKFSNRTKHIGAKYHFTRELVSIREIKLRYVETDNNVADLFTKPLGSVKIKQLREQASMIDVSAPLRESVEC